MCLKKTNEFILTTSFEKSAEKILSTEDSQTQTKLLLEYLFEFVPQGNPWTTHKLLLQSFITYFLNKFK